jgi:hypothetical protein
VRKGLQEAVIGVVADEKSESMKKFPLFNSEHEGYAVILEEVQESEDELELVKRYLQSAWNYIKANVLADDEIKLVKKYAIRLACEAVQVAAMAEKYLDSMEVKNEKVPK